MPARTKSATDWRRWVRFSRIGPTARPGDFTEIEMRELIYGRNAVHECLRAGRRRSVRADRRRRRAGKGALAQSLELAAEKRIPIQRVPRAQLDRIGEGHQGVAAEVSGYPYVALDDLLSSSQAPLFLVLDCVQDPQNLGTLLRTAEAVGVSGVLIAQDRAGSGHARRRQCVVWRNGAFADCARHQHHTRAANVKRIRCVGRGLGRYARRARLCDGRFARATRSCRRKRRARHSPIGARDV